MKISIVTPSFNQDKYIGQTIKSVVDQRGDFELEYIIIDGKSTDNSVNIIKKFAEKNSSINWLSEKDEGQAEAINKGLKIAQGDIVAFLNADDTYEKDTLAKIAAYFKQHPEKKWVFGMCKIVNEENEEIRKFITNYKNYFLRHYSFKKLLAENFISQPATFWKRDLLTNIGYLKEKEYYCLDYDYWLRLGKNYKPGFINSYLANFRYYSDSKTGKVNKKQFQDELRLAMNFKKENFWPLLLHKFNYYKIIIIYKILNI